MGDNQYDTVCKDKFDSISMCIKRSDADSLKRHEALMGEFKQINGKLFIGLDGEKSYAVVQAEQAQQIRELQDRQPTSKGQRAAVVSAAGLGGVGGLAWLADWLHHLITGAGQ